jgi:serine/threonine protein kinase
VITEIADYGRGGAENPFLPLLDILEEEAVVGGPLLAEARQEVMSCWSVHMAPQWAALDRKEGETPPYRLFDARPAELILDYPHASYTPAWKGGAQPLRIALSDGRTVRPEEGPDEAGLRRLAELRHPNILPVTNFHGKPPTLWAEYEWRPGKPLAASHGALSLAEISDYVVQIADALDYAHCHGIIHGRLSQHTVLWDERRSFVSVFDFGFVSSPEGPATQVRRIEPYDDDAVAPEAKQGRPVAASDQYSLAALVYRMFAGTEIDRGKSRRPRDIGQLLAPPVVVDVLERALSHVPEERFGSTMEFADAVRWALDTGIRQSQDRTREHGYLAALRQDCVSAVRGYVNLQGRRRDRQADVPSEASTGAGRAVVRHPILYKVSTPERLHKVRYSEDVSRDLREGGRTLLLGEPGSGKTTTLLHAALEACRVAQMNPTAPVPVVVPLNLYTDTETLEDFVKRQMADLGDDYERLVAAKRILILLDALNEASPRCRQELREFLVKLSDFVVSCRTRDYERDLDSLTKLSIVAIEPLDVRRIKTAFARILGPDDGERLWAKLGGTKSVLDRFDKVRIHGDEDRCWDTNWIPDYTNAQEDESWRELRRIGVMELCRNPFLLRVVCALFEAEGEVPQRRSAIFAVAVRTLISREIDRLATAEGDHDGTDHGLRARFVSDVLVEIASVIQNRHQGTGIAEEDLHRELARRFNHDLGAWAVDLAEDASILSRSNGRVLFTHQLLQEYFASSIMRSAFERGESASRFFPPDSWWHPQDWEETAVILAGVVDGMAFQHLIEWLAAAHPTVCLRCVEEAGAIQELPDSLRDRLRREWSNRWRLEAGRPAPRAAVGRALSAIGDPRRGVGAVAGVQAVPDISWVRAPETGVFISQFPVTVAQFRIFEQAQGGPDSRSAPPEPGSLSMPKTGVSWEEARRFADWLGGMLGRAVRLPFEVEWCAAAGGGGQPYPWGAEWSPGQGNVADGTEHSIGVLSPVGTYGDEPDRPADLLGNVWEWCMDGRRIGPGGGSGSAAVRLLKGGSWRRRPEFAAVGYRYWANADFSADDIGFRLVSEEKVENRD